MIAIKLVADNDTSGNPRRLWLVLDRHGAVTKVHVESYGGRYALFHMNPRLIEIPPIKVSASEYRRWIKYGKEQEIISYG